jgi:hypothetical protein
VLRLSGVSSGGGSYEPIELEFVRSLETLRLLVTDAVTQVRGHWYDPASVLPDTDFDLGCNDTETFLTANSPLRIESSGNLLVRSGAGFVIRSAYDLNFWSDQAYYEFGPPNGETGSPGFGQFLAFRDFDINGNSTDIATIGAAYLTATSSRLTLNGTGGGGVEIASENGDLGPLPSTLIMTAANSTKWKVTVSATGILTTEAL